MRLDKIVGCLNKVAYVPNEYTNTMDKDVMVEKAEVKATFPEQSEGGEDGCENIQSQWVKVVRE